MIPLYSLEQDWALHAKLLLQRSIEILEKIGSDEDEARALGAAIKHFLVTQDTKKQ